jgi:mannan endo-1,4-beta-mannosidase
MRAAAIVTIAVCAIASAVAVVVIRGAGGHVPNGAAPSPTALPGRTASLPGRSALLPARAASSFQVGVVAYNLANFEKAAGVYPAVVVKYLQWGTPFPASEVTQDHGLGATTMLVLEPRHISMASIAAGRGDAYLAEWAAADRSLGLPVILSFAPEANGTWYSWGAGHISPHLYVRAWRHVHDRLIRDGAQHVTWLWQMAADNPGSEALRLLWPGQRYVTEAGIDAQYAQPSATFTSVFGKTITDMQAITSRPLLLSEVAVARSASRPAQITGLFAGVSQHRLAGLIFFDAHPKWAIDNDPPALTAFRKAAARPRKEAAQ